MKNDFININLRIDKETYEFLKTCVNPSAPSVSFIIRRAVDKYFEKTAVEAKAEPIPPAPLNISFPRNISPSSYDVMKAKRAKEAGRPYDKALEPFFEEVDGLIRDAE